VSQFSTRVIFLIVLYHPFGLSPADSLVTFRRCLNC